MAALCRLVGNLSKSIIFPDSNRSISLSATARIKELVETKQGNTLIIEGVITPQKNKDRLLKTKNGACPICSTGLEVKHTDVLILKQFLRSDGCMLPRRITGLCKVQQKRIGIMVTMAQKAGLMPNIAPAKSRKDPKLRKDWRKFNTYYDETTIKHRYF